MTVEKSRTIAFTQFYFLCFLMYATIGWIYEVFLEVIVYRWGFSDRGVLFGPWCPVYGVGAMAFLLCFHRIMNKKEPLWFQIIKPVIIFIGCMLVATAIELMTSYILEALTGSWPWQTYVDYKINFQGRIALSPSLRFGLGGVIFLYVCQPLFRRLLNNLPPAVSNSLSYGLFTVFAVDCVATVVSKL